ncbi:hypothetical protein R1flu_028946 [Riccia fluitans]|uniref:NB-ARC domain-containing protein n=1 Tax=Riccia fluitans TaxID=41844 RepID=A0ABD1XN43_9MARC
MDGASSSSARQVAYGGSEKSRSSGTEVREVSDSLFELSAPASPAAISSYILFFHGLQKEYNSEAHLTTWASGDISGEIWPKTWLSAKYPQARILSVSYDASIRVTAVEGTMDLFLIGEKLLQEILMSREKQGPRCPVILVGHGFGGLVIKRLCLHAQENKDSRVDVKLFLESLRGIFFYGTPHRGKDNILDGSSLTQSMERNESLLRFVEVLNKDAARLHEGFDQKRRLYGWKIYGLGEPDSEASCRYGENWIAVNSDHYSLCKPISETCTKYQHLVHLLDSIFEHSQVRDGIFEYTCFVEGVKHEKEIEVQVGKNMRDRHGNYIPRLGGAFANVWAEVREKKLLLVFDDIDRVSDVELLQRIVYENGCKESRFVVTCRREDLLRQLGAILCQVEPMELESARELFVTHVFPELQEIPHDWRNEVERVVQGCSGLPLTLEVVGSHLRGENRKAVWDKTAEALREVEKVVPILEDRVWSKLRLSVDALGDEEKKMFMDVACYLLVEGCPFSLEEIMSAWDSMYRDALLRWKTLVDRSLVREEEVIVGPLDEKTLRLAVDTNEGEAATRIDGKIRKIQMHDHLRGIGRRIAAEMKRYYVSIHNLRGGVITGINRDQMCSAVSFRAELMYGGINYFAEDSEDEVESFDYSDGSPRAAYASLDSFQWMEFREVELSNLNSIEAPKDGHRK